MSFLPFKSSDKLTFLMPKFSNVPMNGPPPLEKASEKPQNAHWNVTTAMTVSDWKIMASADFRRAIPPYRSPMPGIMRKTRDPMIT